MFMWGLLAHACPRVHVREMQGDGDGGDARGRGGDGDRGRCYS